MSDLSLERAPLPSRIKLPPRLLNAWPHLVMFFVLSAAKQHRDALSALIDFRRLAYGSRPELMKNLAEDPLYQREAALPWGIVSLVFKNLCEDLTSGSPDIVSTYSEYLYKLVSLRTIYNA